jgi:flagellar basal body-associated protein FliL
MKKFSLLIMIIVLLIAFYEEQKAEKNVYIIVIVIGIFMYGMMRLSAKIPSKNQDKEEENV